MHGETTENGGEEKVEGEREGGETEKDEKSGSVRVGSDFLMPFNLHKRKLLS